MQYLCTRFSLSKLYKLCKLYKLYKLNELYKLYKLNELYKLITQPHAYRHHQRTQPQSARLAGARVVWHYDYGGVYGAVEC